MKDKKVLFMGTPLFATVVLDALIRNTNVVGVVCQNDKIVGRKKILTKCPVKVMAEEHNIKVYQPINLKQEYKELLQDEPDIIITCAYGKILNEELINYPKYKTINVHASLLPSLRGGAPIQRAIMNNFSQTGITIMRTDKGMDTGDIIEEEAIDIDFKDTYESLSIKLSKLGADLLIKTLPSIFDNTCIYKKQDSNNATMAPLIKAIDEKISFDDTKINIYNKIRALYDTPIGYAILDGKKVKIAEAIIGDNRCCKNGEIIKIYKNGIGVACLDGEIIIKKLQVEGKKMMDAASFLNGVNKDLLLGKRFM